MTLPTAYAMAALSRDAWSVVARQPIDTMLWEYAMPMRELREARRLGRVLTRQRRGDGEFVLEGRLP